MRRILPHTKHILQTRSRLATWSTSLICTQRNPKVWKAPTLMSRTQQHKGRMHSTRMLQGLCCIAQSYRICSLRTKRTPSSRSKTQQNTSCTHLRNWHPKERSTALTGTQHSLTTLTGLRWTNRTQLYMQHMHSMIWRQEGWSICRVHTKCTAMTTITPRWRRTFLQNILSTRLTRLRPEV